MAEYIWKIYFYLSKVAAANVAGNISTTNLSGSQPLSNEFWPFSYEFGMRLELSPSRHEYRGNHLDKLLPVSCGGSGLLDGKSDTDAILSMI